MESLTLVQFINNSFDISLPEIITIEQLRQQLAEYFNKLINTNFEKLVTLLYRIDVSEAKLKTLLSENSNKSAGEIIAELVIERQLQKIKSQQLLSRDATISEEEKW